MIYDIHKINDEKMPVILKKYVSYMGNIQNKSENTIEGYKIDLVMFFKFLKLYKYMVPSDIVFEQINIKNINNEFINEVKLKDLHEFLKFTEEYRHNGALTRARKVAVLKSFFKYAHEIIKIITINPSQELEAPKQAKKQPVYLNLEESKKLLSVISGRNKERDYCMVTIFLNCGLRLTELCDIKLNDIRNDILIVNGKGDKERSIYLNEACLRAIKVYLKIRNQSYPLDMEHMFISEQRTQINKRTIQKTIKKYIIEAGLDPNKYSVHKLRHTAATLMYKHGNVDIVSLQRILGHENITTTTIYTHVDEEQIRKALSSNPLNNLSIKQSI